MIIVKQLLITSCWKHFESSNNLFWFNNKGIHSLPKTVYKRVVHINQTTHALHRPMS